MTDYLCFESDRRIFSLYLVVETKGHADVMSMIACKTWRILIAKDENNCHFTRVEQVDFAKTVQEPL